MSYSNCNKEEYEQKVKELLLLHSGKECKDKLVVQSISIITDCIHADDTKEMNPNCKCRGTKIICNNSNLSGFTNYSKYCNKYNCKYYANS